MKRVTNPCKKYLKVSLPVLSFLCMLIISSCVSMEASLFEKMKIRTRHIENANYAITLDYPEDWYFKEEDSLLFSSILSFDITAEQGAGLAILRFRQEDVQSEIENMTLDKVIESFMHGLNAEFGGITDTMIGGVGSRQAGFTMLQEKNTRGEITILTFRKFVYILIIVVNPPESFNKYKQIFKAIYESIEFIKDSAQ